MPAVAIAIAGTYLFGPLNPLTRILTAVVADAASQGVLIATGNQEKFNWGQVGKTALIAALTPTPAGGETVAAIATNMVTAAVVNAAAQGAMKLVGLQKDFDWAEVAAAGVTAGAMSFVGAKVNIKGPLAKGLNQFVRGMAGDIAGAAARSLITGTNFGDNLIAALPTTIVQTLGRAFERAAGIDDLDPEDVPPQTLGDKIFGAIGGALGLNGPFSEMRMSTLERDLVARAEMWANRIPAARANRAANWTDEHEDSHESSVAVAHYHRTGAVLDLGHTVNFGRPWLPNSKCEFGLISLPYLDGPALERPTMGQNRLRFLWLIPVTAAEVEFKKAKGMEALEDRFERVRFDYLDPNRASVV